MFVFVRVCVCYVCYEALSECRKVSATLAVDGSMVYRAVVRNSSGKLKYSDATFSSALGLVVLTVVHIVLSFTDSLHHQFYHLHSFSFV
jgi:hypothetical protein